MSRKAAERVPEDTSSAFLRICAHSHEGFFVFARTGALDTGARGDKLSKLTGRVLEKRLRRVKFEQVASAEDHHLIVVHDGVEPVRDCDNGARATRLADCRLDQLVGVLVHLWRYIHIYMHGHVRMNNDTYKFKAPSKKNTRLKYN